MTLGQVYPSPGYCGEIIHLYFCKVDHFEQQNPDEDEFLDFVRIPLSRAVEMVLNGELPDAKTQIAVMKVAMLMKRLRAAE